MTAHVARLLAIVTLVGACERRGTSETQRQQAAAIFKGVLSYPQSTLMSVATGQDAAQVVFASAAPAPKVATWYREMLRLNGWELRSDAVLPDGSISIYADSAARPLWITLKAGEGGLGTTYTLIGAVPGLDSSGAQRSGSSMSSKRIQRR